MYHALVRRQVRTVFRRLGESDWAPLLADTAEDVHHVFPGEHPLGGERHTRAAVERWFERLGHLFPGHDFKVHRVISRGWPWSTWVAVSWTAYLRPREGEPYENHGTHWIQIRWGKAVYFHAYLDTQLIARACEAMAKAGVAEAAAAPIAD
jgi:ketosteroid isomerase-like protein